MASEQPPLERLNAAFDVIADHPELSDFESGASDAEIEQAEKMLSVRFPATYKAFLRKFGVGDFNGREFFGIVPGRLPGSSAPSVVWFTLDERSSGTLPSEFVPIASSGYGTLFCLDIRRMSNDEAPIVEWSSEKNEASVVAESFGEFLNSEILGSMS